MKVLNFVNTFTPLLKEVEGRVIALTPEACYECGAHEIDYSIPEDYFDLKIQKQETPQHCQNFIKWVDAFDTFIKSKLKDPLDKKLDFARLYGFQFKNLFDNVLIGVQALEAVIKQYKPDKIQLFLRKQAHLREPNDWLFSQDLEIAYVLLPLLSEKYSISFECIVVEDCQTERLGINSANLSSMLKQRMVDGKELIKKGILQLCAFEGFLRKKFWNKGVMKLNVLILHTCWMGKFIRASLQKGYEVNYFWELSKKKLELEAGITSTDWDQCTRFWDKLAQQCFEEFYAFSFANKTSGLDLSVFLKDYLDYFLRVICPRISIYAKVFDNYIQQKEIHAVITPYRISPEEISVMAVAAMSLNTKAIQIEHGAGDIIDPIWTFSEVPTDTFVACNNKEAAHFKELFREHQFKATEVVAGNVWLDRYQKEIKKRKRNLKLGGDDGRRQRIFFIPSAHGIQRLNATYQDRWVYRLYESFFDYFVTETAYDFFIKADAAAYYFSPYLKKYIEQIKASNIFFLQGDLVRSLRSADRVITDYPSTPTFESMLLGLPVLSLFHEKIDVKVSDLHNESNALREFISAQDAIKIMKIFIRALPEDYIVPMDQNFENPTLISIIEKICNVKDVC